MTQKILGKPLRFPSKYGVRPEAQMMVRSLLDRDPRTRLPCCAQPVGYSSSSNASGQPQQLDERRRSSSSVAYASMPEDSALGLLAFKELPFFSMMDWEAVKNRTYKPPFTPPTSAQVFDDTSNFDKEFTDISVSIVSIEDAIVQKADGTMESNSLRKSEKNQNIDSENESFDSSLKDKGPGAAARRSSLGHSVDQTVYKDFDFFDPSFRSSYLLGNSCLLSTENNYNNASFAHS